MDVTKCIIFKIYAYSKHLLPIYVNFKAKQQSFTSLMNMCGLDCTDHSFIRGQSVYEFYKCFVTTFQPLKCANFFTPDTS